MDNMGKLIVLEGLDGSGKSTQFELLKERFKQSGLSGQSVSRFKGISFPDYSDDSSALVRMYLSGEFSSDPAAVNAYAASVFYAADRYASFMRFWREDYLGGAFILAARYTTSNCIYQMAKLDTGEWDGYLGWLEELEYNKLGLPKPDAVVFLDMPIDVSQKLLSRRYMGDETKKDIHENDVSYLRICRDAALYAAKRQGWYVIGCAKDGQPLSEDSITRKILSVLGSEKQIL